ncbi:MAG TPA: peptidylprolyl isomerase [Noviherbaspirillum sp.]|nr:peptidylprolyl isomerase [Noviherbaspirillum sp.]
MGTIQGWMVGRGGCRAIVLSLAMIGAGASIAAPSAAGNAAEPRSIFADVAGTVITHEEYNAAFALAARNKFYHSKAGGDEVALLQRETADKMITRVLLLQEAKRRGLQPDEAEIQKTLQTYEQRYANSEHWKKNREQLLPGLKARHAEDNLLAQIEKLARTVEKPDENAVRAYYKAYPEKFTQPEQIRVSVILLKVDPSSPSAVWEKTGADAADLVKRIREGADFAELARQYSNDESAANGGDMGYLHLGMLSDVAEAALKKMQPGELSEPIKTLQGAAIFRLTDRKIPTLASFDAVKARAEELLKREQSEAAWTAFVAGLKQKYQPQIDQSRFLPLSEEASAKAAAK